MSGKLGVIGIALAIGLGPMWSAPRATAASSTPESPAATAGESSANAALVAAALPDSIPRSLMLGTVTSPSSRGPMSVWMAGAEVRAGAGVAGGLTTFASRASGVLRLGIVPRLAVEARTALLTLDRGGAFERRLVRSQVRLRGGSSRAGVWASGAIERSLAGTPRPAAVLLGLGAWAASGRLDLAFSVEETNEHARVATVLPPSAEPATRADSTGRVAFDDRLVRSTATMVNGRWAYGRLGIESVAGVTLSRHFAARRWMQTSFDLAVRPRLAVYATFGSNAPRWLALEPGLSHNARLGLRLTSAVNAAVAEPADVIPRAPEFGLRHLGEDWYVIEVRARAMGPVEVMGDFSGWESRALRHVTGARWALAMRLEPGVHQIQVRVDGGVWSPPWGLPAASDGFNGDVGVFVAGAR
jgi:hypothetical protein